MSKKVDKSEKRSAGHVTYHDPVSIEDYEGGLELAREMLALKTHLAAVHARLNALGIARRLDTPFGALRAEVNALSASATVRLGEVLMQLRELELKGKSKAVAAATSGTQSQVILGN